MTVTEMKAAEIYREDRRRREEEIVFSPDWWRAFLGAWIGGLLMATILVGFYLLVK